MKNIKYEYSLVVPSILFNNMLHVAPYVMDLEDIKEEVEFTNVEIEGLISLADNKAKTLLVQMEQRIDKSNHSVTKVSRIRKTTSKKLNSLINDLIDETNYIAHNMVEIGKVNGYHIICELVMVKIGDRLVWIDPLRVAEF
jgi:hypothetical protein